MLKIFCNIYLRCIKKQRALIILCAFGLLISTSLLSVIQMMKVGRESYASSHGEELNHGDLAVGVLSNEGKNLLSLDQVKIQFYNYIKSVGDIDFTYESIFSDDKNLFYVNSDSYAALAPVIRFIDFEKINFYTNQISGKLTKKDVVLAENLARRCSVNIDDSVYISPEGRVFPMKMHVSAIVSNREILIQNAVENSYVYMDRDSLYDALQITDDYVNNIGYTKDTFCFTLPTYFYISGSNDVQNTILSELKEICRKNDIDYNKLLISTADDASRHIAEVYGYMDVLLSVFAVLNFIMSCFIICYLVYLILINHIQDFNVLRILGLSKRKNTFLIWETMMACFISPIIFGNVLGYFMTQLVVRETSLYGLMQLGISEIIKASSIVIGVSIMAIVIITLIIVCCANKYSIEDILRKENLKLMNNMQAGIVAVVIVFFIFVVFSSIASIATTAVFLGAILVIAIIAFVLALILIKLFTLIPAKRRFKLSIIFFKRNSAKIALITLPITIAISIMYIIITMTSTLLAETDKTLVKTMGYNMQIMTTGKGDEKLEEFLKHKGIASYYSQSESWCTIKSINGFNVELESSVFLYNQIPPVETMKALENGIIINANLAKSTNLKKGDVLEIETEYGVQKIGIADIYNGNQLNNFPLAIVQNKDIVKNERTNYYLLLEEDKETVKEFVNHNDDMIMLSPSKMLFDIASIFIDNKAVIYILDILFSIGSFILVLYSTIILYQGRNREFSVYEVYGATEKLIRQQVDKECIFIGVIVSICGIISSVIFTYFIGKYSLPIMVNKKLLLVITVTALVVMVLASFVTKKILTKKRETLSSVLRYSK